jgi:transmembrane sensor
VTGIDWELLDRYLALECVAEERQRVERWMTGQRSNRERVELLAEALIEASAAPIQGVEALVEHRLGTARKSFSLMQRREWLGLARIAALVVVVVAGGLIARAILSPDREAASPTPPARVISTLPGQRANLRLPDGTSVMLGVASTLRHPASFRADRREVQLEGEAYFEVVHDEKRAFTVRAGDIVAEDLGTEFVVRAYPEDRYARVVVRAGRIALRAAAPRHASQQALLPGQLGRLEPTGEPVIERVDTAPYFAWTEGRLVFDDVELSEALPQLSRWYDLDFRLADNSLGRVPLTATLSNQPTEDVLDLLAASLGMRQVRNGRTVTFFPGTRGR